MYLNIKISQKLKGIGIISLVAVLILPYLLPSKAFASTPGSVGTWNTNPISLPFSNSAAGVAVYNNYIYVTDRDTAYYAPFNADDSVGAWTTSPNHLPIAGDGALHEYNGYLYNIGARTSPWGTYYAKINADASIGPWQTTTQLPLPLYGTNSFIYDGYLYVVGGTCFMWCAEMDSVYTAPINADGTVGSWTLADETLPYASSAAQIGVFGGYAYYVGGDANSTKVLTAPLGPNGYIGAWTEQTGSPLPAGTRSAATTIVNGYMFLAGGWTDANPNTNVFSAPLHPGGTLGTWSAQTSLPGPNGRAGATTHNGNLYIIGGQVNNFSVTVDTILYNVVYGALAANDPTSLGPTALTNNSYGTNNQPTFTFSQSDPNVSEPNVRYEIEVSTSNDFSSLAIDYTSAFGAQGSASFTVGQAAGSGTYNVGSSGQTLTDGNYYWRVRTTNEFLVSSSFTNASSGTTAFKVDATAPTASSLSPTNSATGVALDSDLTMNLSEPAYLHSGNITINKISDNSVVEAISATGDQVSGGDTSTLTINPSSDLAYGTSYYVKVDAGAITDVAGNNLSGFNNSSSWQFESVLTPQQTAINKIHDYAVDSDSNPAPTVTDYATAGTSGVTSSNLSDVNVVVAATDPTDLTTAGGISQVVAVPVSTDTILDYASTGGTSSAPVLQDYTNVEITGVTGDNLGDVNEAVASSGAADVSDLQIAANKGAATHVIKQYATSGGTSATPTLSNYQTAGITGVTSDNLGKVNAAVASAGQISTSVVQGTVNKGVAIVATMNSGPNSGDANDDGTLDSQQTNVMSFVNNTDNKYAVVTVNNTCTLINATSSTGTSGNSDSGYTYPDGLVNYTANCGSNGYTTTATVYQYGVTRLDGLVLRKYNPTTHKYSNVPDASIALRNIGGQSVAVATYSITDGGPLDSDGVANGVIVDPVGLASKDALGAPNTGLAYTSALSRIITVFIGMGLLGAITISLRRRSHGRNFS